MQPIQLDEMLFFEGKRGAFALYDARRSRMLGEIADVSIEVKKTQISFKNRHLFAAVSFLPVRRVKDRPRVFITVSFGLFDRLASPRVDAASEPYPNRWTHHVLIGSAAEVDDELMGWLKEAARLASLKR